MKQLTAKRILDIQECILTDNTRVEEYKVTQTAFLTMLPELTEVQRDILLDYLGVCVELHLQMLEKAIEMK